MRRAKFASIAIGLAALPLFAGIAARAQMSNPAQTINGVKKQTGQAASGQSSANPAAKTAAAAPSKPQSKPAAKTPAKQSAKVPAKTSATDTTQVKTKPAAKAPSKAQAKAAGGKPAEEVKTAKRDPFAPLLNQKRAGGPSQDQLPPGKPGLVIATLRLQGIVRGPAGMIAIVANPSQSVYFLREGDQLYDGRVVSIKLDEVAFHEYGKDAFGKPIDRQVSKRLYPIAGEQ
jgi:Tfp pilus assembly protein PilP